MLPYALENVKSRRQETIQILLEVLDDEDVTAHAVGALAKLKAVEAIPVIRKCLDSGIPLVRREAAKALKKLGKEADQPADDDVSPFSPASRPPHEGSVESSTCFDLDQVVPFLDRVAALVKGFGPPDIQRIESCLFDMEPDQEASFDFQVRHQGDEMPLQIRIYMDDIDTPDMAFFTSPELAEAIDQLMDKQE